MDLKYKPNVCSGCMQTTDYELPLDKGSAYIVIAIANAQRRLNKKEVHLEKEMLADRKDYVNIWEMAKAGKMYMRQIDNVLRPKYHGLVAQGSQSGTYLITKKGAKFLRGEAIPRTAIVEKRTHSKKAYWNEHDTIDLPTLIKSDEIFFWEGERDKLRTLAAFLDQETLSPKLW